MGNSLRPALGIHRTTDPLHTRETKLAYAAYGRYGGVRGVLLGQHVRHSQAGAELTAMISRYGVRPAYVAYRYVLRSQSVPFNDTLRSTLTTHANDGGLCGILIDAGNMVTGQNEYDRSRSDTSSVDSLLLSAGSSSAKTAWYAVLDDLADTLNALVDSQGRKIPVLIRLFPEANGWISYLSGEGVNGVSQVETRTITSLVGSGTVLTAVLANRPSPAELNFSLTAGSYCQITGASAGYNGGYYISAASPSTDPVGSPVTLTLIKSNGATVTAGTAAALGSIYLNSGFNHAGRDRSVNLMQLISDTITYLRTTKGITNALFGTAPYPKDSFGAHWTSTETNLDVAGRDLAYSNWYPGHSKVDVWGMDYYYFSSVVANASAADSVLVSTTKALQVNGGGKPFFCYEFGNQPGGATAAGSAQEGYWTRTLDAFVTQWPISGFSLWDQGYFPTPSDPAGPSFAAMVADPRCITLAKFQRGY